MNVQAGSIAFMAIWTTYAVYTASLGEITTKEATSDSGLDISYKVRLGPRCVACTASRFGRAGVQRARISLEMILNMMLHTSN